MLQNSTAGSCKVSCQTPQPSAALLRGRHLRCHCRVRRATPEPARCTPWARHRGARELPRRAAGQSGGKGTRGHTLTVDRLAPITPYLADSGSERLIHGSVRRASCKELDVVIEGSPWVQVVPAGFALLTVIQMRNIGNGRTATKRGAERRTHRTTQLLRELSAEHPFLTVPTHARASKCARAGRGGRAGTGVWPAGQTKCNFHRPYSMGLAWPVPGSCRCARQACRSHMPPPASRPRHRRACTHNLFPDLRCLLPCPAGPAGLPPAVRGGLQGGRGAPRRSRRGAERPAPAVPARHGGPADGGAVLPPRGGARLHVGPQRHRALCLLPGNQAASGLWSRRQCSDAAAVAGAPCQQQWQRHSRQQHIASASASASSGRPWPGPAAAAGSAPRLFGASTRRAD